VSDRDHPRDERDGRDGPGEAVSTLVGEQLRAARAEVFRAYLRATEKARALGDDEDAGTSHRDGRFEHRHAS
jgi:hypothetical protein